MQKPGEQHCSAMEEARRPSALSRAALMTLHSDIKCLLANHLQLVERRGLHYKPIRRSSIAPDRCDIRLPLVLTVASLGSPAWLSRVPAAALARILACCRRRRRARRRASMAGATRHPLYRLRLRGRNAQASKRERHNRGTRDSTGVIVVYKGSETAGNVPAQLPNEQKESYYCTRGTKFEYK